MAGGDALSRVPVSTHYAVRVCRPHLDVGTEALGLWLGGPVAWGSRSFHLGLPALGGGVTRSLLRRGWARRKLSRWF